MATAIGRARIRRVAIWSGAILCVLLFVLAVFPWGLLVGYAAAPLSRALSRPVSIGSARRLDAISFSPTIELGDVRIAQPSWAGPGDMVSARSVRMTLPVFPLLLGHVRPNAIEAEGLKLHLVRDARGRANWSGDDKSRRGGGRGPSLRDLTVPDGRIRLDDAKRHLALDASLRSDRRGGVRLDGSGTLRDAPISIAVRASGFVLADPGRPYPMRVAIRSKLASIAGVVRMDHPLDTGHFTANVRASGRDLCYLDDIIQAGLFRTQPFRLSASVRHDDDDWRIPHLDATIGRSAFVAAITVTKPDGRTRLDGRVDARTLDFDDFASDEQRARAAAEKARIGPRVVPGTRIVLEKVKLDGVFRLRAARLLSQGASPFRSLDATATLDDRRLTLSPLTVDLPRGRMTGTATVDDRNRAPRLSLDLRIDGATIDSFFPDQQVVAGPLRARLRLAGTGPTVREALARGDGTVGIAVDRGSVRRDYATFLGGDVFKSIGTATQGGEEGVALDCLVANFAVSHGRMTPRPLLLATAVARGDGQGTVQLGPETIDLRIDGRPTRPGLLVSTAPVRLFGTLSHPRIDVRPPRAKDEKQGGLLSRVGFFVKKLRVRGNEDVKAAAPVDCPAEVARALR